ncbi:TVP38/TMEM64 family protein [Jannaschia sp. Os4]|uniref:TVP38/TMEM64 family protein n=1 Tax=Jannaschia sp. Os4 TaxID=2807617 RepID=UPI00193A7119|nr:TVP38/TMEM64 family protein [Jannaschia sp. Os4]MBM2577881.1 TVP38/TMEM64 family protein [Jannaschia sp. Os4]
MTHRPPPAEPGEASDPRPPPKKRLWLWPAILVALAVGMWLTPWRDYVVPMREWVEARGAWGWVAFVLAYAVVVILPLPAVAMSLVGGLVFGLWGLPLSLTGSLLGALVPYWIGRHWLRDWVMRRVDDGRVDAAMRAMRDDPALFVTLLRLTPILPFTLQNWLLGLTPIRPLPYVWATVAGLFPGTLAVVWIGALGGVAALGRGSAEIGVMAAGLAAFGALVAWLTWKAMRALKAAGFHV